MPAPRISLIGGLPLYREAAEARPGLRPDGHAGLWFDRFFNAYHWDAGEGVLAIDKNGGKKGEKSRQDQWLDALVRASARDPAPLARRLAAYRARVERLVKARGGRTQAFRSDWNFVTGMGLPHPLENGLAWHPTLGVPYLAGAGVKGLLRGFFTHWTDLDGGLIERWFGPELDGPEDEAAAGEFVFFDAVPVVPPALMVDVMTPHMGKWYEEGGEIELDEKGRLPPERVPADWHDPVPVKFLAVRDIRLLFAIAPRRRGAGDVPEAEALKALFDGLRGALEWVGAGAKTAVGYGRFEESAEA
ncbi:CRISPR-associated protein Cmr6 [Methylomagnum ishizawai]|uniref:CRISPR-associated protein Cmr6 n=1 Tax=Methylomagnum ishizawai TaxID=1760988 RepID=A0A1Y6D4D3_9GAMM|nr:type III-B CRISPR module RAMP protein Cmr6 [Methylomagnum ishizawai]SMF95244.1 CRISPR-associated protein Cmr6 [Methylomagnum ishizawai]